MEKPRVLVVDDDPNLRKTLCDILRVKGYETLAGKDGTEGLALLKENEVNLVLLDLGLPDIPGLEVLARIKADAPATEVIILTGNATIDSAVEATNRGAFSYLVKPYEIEQLLNHIRRAIEKQEAERQIAQHHIEMEHAYKLISADLAAAAEIQKNLLPRASTIEGVRFDWLFYPSSFVAGDIFNYFRIGEGRVGFYLLDVSGHGVPAAMLSVSLSWILSQMVRNEGGSSETLSRQHVMAPAKVLEMLNSTFQESRTSGQYITMIYGVLDCAANRLSISQAGLPAPVYCSSSGSVETIGSGGFPVGLAPESEYDEETIDFHPGDRLILYSDGVTECFNSDSHQFSEERLVALIKKSAGQPLENMLKTIENELTLWRGDTQFDDDVTMLAIERERK